MPTNIDVQTYLLQKAESDFEFRKRLIADPKGVIKDETGLELPDDTLVFIGQAIDTAQQAVPSADTPLTQGELAQAMGGSYISFGDECEVEDLGWGTVRVTCPIF